MTLFSPDYKKNGGYWLEPGAWGTKIFTGVDYDKRDLKEDFPVNVNEWHHVSITAMEDGAVIFELWQDEGVFFRREIHDDRYESGKIKFFAGKRNNEFKNVKVWAPTF